MKKLTEMVGTTQAAWLLKICTQRVRQLLYEGRIIGAKKIGQFWNIPTFSGMPKIKEGKRGPKGTWRKRLSLKQTFIHINTHTIRDNKKNGTYEPVILVKSGSHKMVAHHVKINGPCELIYSVNGGLGCKAKAWVAADPDVMVEASIFANMT
ncbi:MAG: DNA-binding protein [Cyanobacteria bacterium J06628_3]